MYGCIVVGTDFSETASQAVDQAAELARLCGATLHIVSGFRPTIGSNLAASSIEAMAYGGADVLRDVEVKLGEEVETTLERLAKSLADTGVQVQTHAIAGDPADALIDVAEHNNADLLVVGNRGMSGAKRFILGSVPNKLTHHAPCSVLVVQTC
jgi:nucleotide-binding universal stress UspA family protein